MKLFMNFLHWKDKELLIYVLNVRNIQFIPALNSIYFMEINQFNSHIKLAHTLKNGHVYQFTFRVNTQNNKCLVGLISDNIPLNDKWFKKAREGFALDLNKGQFQTMIDEYTPIRYEMQEYLDWDDIELNSINKNNFTISVRVNRINQTARYFINSLDLGIAYHLNKNDKYWICYTLTSSSQQMVLLNATELQYDDAYLSEHDKDILCKKNYLHKLELQHTTYY